MENKEVYEHWDKLNENSLKGFTYKVKDGQMIISEYLDITQNKDEITYTATVLGQNQGIGIHFQLKQSDSIYAFENPDHGFPKKIFYQKLSDNEIYVRVSDGKQKGFSYKMTKQNINQLEKVTSMKKVTGIGGIFFKSKDPNKMKEWYKTHLGFRH